MTMRSMFGCALAGLLLSFGRGSSAQQAPAQVDEGGSDLKAMLAKAKDPGVNQRLSELMGDASPVVDDAAVMNLAYAGSTQETCDLGQALMRDKTCFAEYKRTGKVSSACAQRARATARKTGHCKQYAKGGGGGGGSRPHGGSGDHSGGGGGNGSGGSGNDNSSSGHHAGGHSHTCCIWSGCSQFHGPSCGGHNGSGCYSNGPVGTACGGSYCFQYCNGS